MIHTFMLNLLNITGAIWENDSSKLNFIFVSCPKIKSMLVTDLIKKNIVDQSRTRNVHGKNVGQKMGE